MKLAIYAGHGGDDSGAVSGRRTEKDLNLDVMLRVSKILNSNRHKIINNRTTDINRDITKDINLANRKKVDAVIEIHFNKYNRIANGAETIYKSGDNKSKALANAIVNNISAIGFKNLGAKTEPKISADQIKLMHQTDIPTVIVNCAYIDNENDMATFNAKRMAQAIARGIVTALAGDSIKFKRTSAVLKIPSAGALTINSGMWNIYSTPGDKKGKILSQVYGGQRFCYTQKTNDWFYLPTLRGWIPEEGVSEVSIAVDNNYSRPAKNSA